MGAGAHVEALRPAGPTGWLALDADGAIVAASPSLAALIGSAPGPFAARVAPPDRAALGAALAHPGVTSTLRGRRPDGAPFVVSLAAVDAPVPGAAGIGANAPSGTTTLLVGRRAGGPVRLAADPPTPEGDAAMASETAARGVDHVLSHDLRGAVRQATGFVTVARRAVAAGDDGSGADEGPAGHLGIALRSLATADAAALGVVRWLRLGDAALTVAPLPASEPVVEAASRLGERVGDPSATARLVVEHADLAATPVVVDRSVAAEGLVELLANAVVFWPGDGPVVIGVRAAEPGWCELTVRDGGPGVADPQAAMTPGRMLQPRGAFPGVGMGLALCAVVAARHGGWCTVTSEERPDGAEPGTVAVLGLPVG